MSCPKCSETLKRCPEVYSSDCIKYVGDNSECNIFCKGQSVSEVIEAIDAETCTLKTNTDVSQIDIRNYCGKNCDNLKEFYQSKGYDEQNVSNFIDFLLSYDCVLQGQINGINAFLLNFQTTVKVNLECLGLPCPVASTLPTSDAIQILIDAYCNQQTALQEQGLLLIKAINTIKNLQTKLVCLTGKVENIDTQLNGIPTSTGTYNPVIPDSCNNSPCNNCIS
jgi:hypothetical protein